MYYWKGETVTVLADSRSGDYVTIQRANGETLRVQVSELSR